mgnify:CR=1 FL=1
MSKAIQALVNTPQENAFEAIRSERAYQNSKWRRPDSTDPAGHNPHTITEWLAYMQFYVNEGLRIQTVSHREGDGLDFLRKVAALGVAGMEQHGAPRREGY